MRKVLWPVLLAMMSAYGSETTRGFAPCDDRNCFGIDWRSPSYKDLSELDPSTRDARGRLPIHYAAQNCSPHQVFTSLITSGADMNAFDPATGMTPLELSMTVCRVGTIRTLLGFGADPNFQSVDGGGNAIHLAIRRQLPRNIITQLTEGDTDLDLADADGVRPLIHFMAIKDVEMIDTFLDAGADPDVRDANGNTVAHYAANAQDKDLLSKLRSLDADLGAAAHDGRTPLHISAAHGMDADLVAIYYLADVDPNPVDAFGLAPIHYAVAKTSLEEVTSLIVMGADPNLPDANGDMPLHYALRHNPDVEVTRMLLGLGADPNVPGARGHLPIMLAVRHRDSGKFLDLLVDAGADPNIHDLDGRSLLHHAILENNSSAATSLILGGADIFKTDSLGQSPVALAELVDLGNPARSLINQLVQERAETIRARNEELAQQARTRLDAQQEILDAQTQKRAQRLEGRKGIKTEFEGNNKLRQVEQRRSRLERNLARAQSSNDERLAEKYKAQIAELDLQAQSISEQIRKIRDDAQQPGGGSAGEEAQEGEPQPGGEETEQGQ